MKITIITLGKLKEFFWREAEAEYLKRLQAFAKLEIVEIKEESFTEKDKPEAIKQKEAEKITNILNKTKDTFIICLDEHGQQYSSINFSKQFNNLTMQPYNNIIFIIGGPLGLDKTILQKSNLLLSLSSLTFTHQMVRIFLLEQIYRAYMINENRKYHY